MRDVLLVLDASTEQMSVALCIDGQLAIEQQVPARRSETGARTEGLVPAIVRCLAELGVASRQLTGIICSGGPGGFTGLRTAASIAKGMCFALNVPLYAVPTLELLVAGVAQEDGTYVGALDAGRGEYYAGVVTVRDGVVEPGEPVHVLSRTELDMLLAERHATLIGPIAGGRGALSVRGIPRLLDRILREGKVELDTWEPAYGRLAEAQVKWEATHGRPLQT
jgi:tRNA threonylcarbamoyladenosine biosynthesis protein TsaB